MKIHLTVCLTLFSPLALAKKTTAVPTVGSPNYVYEARSAETKKQFWAFLPKTVQDEIARNCPGFEYVTACKGSFGGGRNDVVVSVVMAGNKTGAVQVFQMNQETIKSQRVIDVSSLPLDGTPNDYIESYCETGQYALKSGEMASFTRKPTAQEPIILLKTYQMNGLQIFGLDSKKGPLTSIGSISPP